MLYNTQATMHHHLYHTFGLPRMLYNIQATMHHHLYHTFGYHQLCIINRIIRVVVRCDGCGAGRRARRLLALLRLLVGAVAQGEPREPAPQKQRECDGDDDDDDDDGSDIDSLAMVMMVVSTVMKVQGPRSDDNRR